MDQRKKCPHCSIEQKTVNSYVQHYKCHVNVPNLKFICPYMPCSIQLSSHSSLKSHIFYYHSDSKCPSNPCERSSSSMVCTVFDCPYETYIKKDFVSHLCSHMDGNDLVLCPYDNCDKKYSNRSSFTSHLQYKHEKSSIPKKGIEKFDACHGNSEQGEGNTGENDINQLEKNMLEGEQENFRSSMDDMALFFLQLHCKQIVPNSTIQLVYEQFKKSCDNQWTLITKIIMRLAEEKMIDDDMKKSIMQALEANDIYKDIFKELRSNYMRMQYFKKQFNYIAPIEIALKFDSPFRQKNIYYVPIIDSIKLIIQNGPVKYGHSRSSFFEDIYDGMMYKQNHLFETLDSLKIILYQDSFETCNPLGSSKLIHKMCAVYFTLGNLPPHQRSRVDTLQLVMLFDDKLLTTCPHEELFGQLITDLKKIETVGVLKADGTYVKGSIHSMPADNLGAHTIGGYKQIFNAEYFCRFCMIGKGNFHERPTDVGTYRNPANYTAEVQKEFPTSGVSFNSTFNEL